MTVVSQYTIDTLPVNFLKCRAFGHSWEEYIPAGKRRGIGFRFSLLCTSCSMERHDACDSSGNLIHGGRHYVPPEGYYNIGKYSRAEFRVVYNRRRKKTSLARRGHLSVAK